MANILNSIIKFKAGGAGKISWDIVASSRLPEGLAFDISKGSIEGTPKAVGEYKFSITASTYIGKDTKKFTLSVNVAPDDPNPSPKGQSNEGGGGGCNSVSGMIMVIGLCVMHGLKINRRN